jgi:excisionase family DNA binding protein
VTSEPLTLFPLEGKPARRRSAQGNSATRPLRQGDLARQPTTSASASEVKDVSEPAVEDISAGGLVGKMLLTTTEAARALGIGRSKLYELIRAGAVESVLIGTCRRVPAVSVVKYVEELRTANR